MTVQAQADGCADGFTPVEAPMEVGASEVAVAGRGLDTRTTRAARSRSLAWEATKRLTDVLQVLVVLPLLLPLLALIALMIKLDSPGPVLFRQTRHGRNRRPFVVLKFRTMRHQVSSEAHRRYIAELARCDGRGQSGLKKLTVDDRVTRLGAFLRRTSLDELPQLVNVLLGQMSIVGPRPAIDYELEHYDPEHFTRFDVKPGLTGLWQVSGRNELGFREMLALDAEYARSYGPLTDAWILLRTPSTLVRRRAA